MLKAASPLQQTALGSALGSTSTLRPSGSSARKTMIASLMLTSLVDAFSILVIFLIMNHATNSEVLNLGNKITLPQARESELIQTGVEVRLEGGNIMIEDKPVRLNDLAVYLKRLNASVDVAKREGLVIVADRNLDYAALSPIILAGSQAGFSKFKFAVIRKD